MREKGTVGAVAALKAEKEALQRRVRELEILAADTARERDEYRAALAELRRALVLVGQLAGMQ